MTDRKTKLEKKLRSYRSARLGSVFLTVVSGLVLLTLLATDQADSDTMTPTYAATFFWPALAYICHLKIRLIRLELSQSHDGVR